MPTYDDSKDDSNGQSEIDLSPIAEASQAVLDRIEELGWQHREELQPLVTYLECNITTLRAFCGQPTPNFKVE